MKARLRRARPQVGARGAMRTPGTERLAVARAAVARAWATGVFAVLLGIVAARVEAQDSAYIHVVRAGETLASIAQTYYGDPKREQVLVAENGLTDQGGSAIVEGLRLVIPTVRYHSVSEGDTFRELSQRYYGDAERAGVIMRANDKKPGSTPDVGAQLLIPYPVRHVVKQGESLSMVAEQYYEGKDDQRLLRSFNPGKPRMTRGHIVLVPLVDLKLSAEGRKRVEQSVGGRVEMGETRAAQVRIEQRLPELREHVQKGRFIEAVALGNELLGSGQVTGYQQISIQRELATTYVALGREDLAVASFRSVLEKQPDLELDTVRTSPRVLKALFAARKAIEIPPQGKGP